LRFLNPPRTRQHSSPRRRQSFLRVAQVARDERRRGPHSCSGGRHNRQRTRDPLEVERFDSVNALDSRHLGRACNSVQGATARMAFAATPATWNLQLIESKESYWVRIPPSPPLPRSRSVVSVRGVFRPARASRRDSARIPPSPPI